MPRHLTWLFYSLVSTIAWTAWALVARAATETISPLALHTMSSFALFPLCLASYAFDRRRVRLAWSTGALFGFLGGATAGLGNIAMFSALTEGGSTVVVLPLTGLYPLVTVILAITVLRESLTWLRVLGIVGAVIAMGLFNFSEATPNTVTASTSSWTSFGPWVLWAIVALVAFGFAGFFQKLASNTLAPTASVLWFAVAFLVIAVAIFIANPQIAQISSQGLSWSIGFGALTWVGLLTTFAAYREGPAISVTVLISLYPVLSALAAIYFFDERIDTCKGLAIGISLAAIVLLCVDPTTDDATPLPTQLKT